VVRVKTATARMVTVGLLLAAGISVSGCQNADPFAADRAGASSHEEAYTVFVEAILSGDSDTLRSLTLPPGDAGSPEEMRQEHFGLSEPVRSAVSVEVTERLEPDEGMPDLGVRLAVSADGEVLGSIIVYTREEQGRCWVSGTARSL